jgi:benzoate-CoA ligase
VLDDEGRVAGAGTVGDLWVKGDSAAAYYWRQHAKSLRTFCGEWVATGDRYRVDEDGFYWYEGRADDMIKIGGEWVSPIEIENALMAHPAVYEAAVVGARIDGVMRIRAAVVLTTDRRASPELTHELQAWCKSRLQRYQYPHVVDVVDELPKTVSGKIQRFMLRGAAE